MSTIHVHIEDWFSRFLWLCFVVCTLKHCSVSVASRGCTIPVKALSPPITHHYASRMNMSWYPLPVPFLGQKLHECPLLAPVPFPGPYFRVKSYQLMKLSALPKPALGTYGRDKSPYVRVAPLVSAWERSHVIALRAAWNGPLCVRVGQASSRLTSTPLCLRAWKSK